MTTSSHEIAPPSTEPACPSWCAGSATEHDFERANGFSVEHFCHLSRSDDQPIPTIGVTMTVNQDGTSITTIGVESDEYPVDMAEQTALAMLEAVRIVRQEARA